MEPVIRITCFVFCFTLLIPTNPLYISKDKDSLMQKLEEYNIVTPISTDLKGNFLSHEVSRGHRARFPRNAEDANYESSDKIYYNVTIFGKEFHLRLKLNAKLIAPGATIEWEEDSIVFPIEHHHKNCLYVGDITDLANASVAISNCDGLAGMIRTDKEEFFIEPLEKDNKEESGRSHIVYRRSAVIKSFPSQNADTHHNADVSVKERYVTAVVTETDQGDGAGVGGARSPRAETTKNPYLFEE
ncbi:PREDICTED: A disintegrin and metalloproteinase with thrombospondin motifs 3-like [Nanorana parkeri]|uniref:A disintegrin and metalloproteinase with thrombospondin motifs 3-like n=1 Tax=Nanorana parkeri TaxID=125878 RepID=UPI0008545DCB|nr:PREDICTED: A disintegrin and metalloproteinase with thrombospondin motifs 3-like [Nanorana parkeri]